MQVFAFWILTTQCGSALAGSYCHCSAYLQSSPHTDTYNGDFVDDIHC